MQLQKKKQRCKTIQIDDDTSNFNIDILLKRAYEERLLPNFIQQNSPTSSTFQKKYQHKMRDLRMNSLSLTRPIQFTKEDFIEPKERFQKIYDSFTKGTKPVEYFQNKIVDAYAFEPQIIFENCEEKQKLSPFKDLLITDKRQIVFNQKLDEVFIGHKVQEIESPLKGSNFLSLQASTKQLISKDAQKKEDFFDDSNFNITQHNQGSHKFLPFIKSNNHSNSINATQSQKFKFNLKQHTEIFPNKKRLLRMNADLQKINYTTAIETQFNPYQPENEVNEGSNNFVSKKESVNMNDKSQYQKIFRNKQQHSVQVDLNQRDDNCKQGSIRKLVTKNQYTNPNTQIQQSDKDSSFSSPLKESFQQLYKDKQYEKNNVHQRQFSLNHPQSGQFSLNNPIAQLSRVRQLKQNKSSSLANSSTNSLSLKKDSKYLIDNFSSVHNQNKIRENPIQEYLTKQNELANRKLLLYEIN